MGCGSDPTPACVVDRDCSAGFVCIDAFCQRTPSEQSRAGDASVGWTDAWPSPSVDASTPVGGDASTANDSGAQPPEPTPLPELEYDVVSELSVRSDGPGGESPHELFWTRFGDGSIEAPDLYSNNHPGEPHITELAGGPTGNFFRFWIHRDIDRERDRYPEIDDRQRNEVKTFAGSPAAGIGRAGETVRYHWYFRIPDGYAVTRYFNSLMQVKGSTGSGSPMLALVAARSAGDPELQVRYVAEDGGRIEYLARIPFERVTGKWLEGEVIVVNAMSGYLRTTVREVNGPLLIATEASGLRTFRPDFEYVRPKWGIYRSVRDMENLPNDTDTLDVADLSVQKIRLR